MQAEPEALALIARAAEGSVRDTLSLFDQAIAHAAGPVRAEDVRQMLGLADRVRIIDLFEALLRGDIATALQELRDQYNSGADPLIVLTELAEFTHFVTRVKVVPSVAQDFHQRGGAQPRARLCHPAFDARSLAHLADAAESAGRGEGGAASACGGRNGAGAHCLCRRSADTGRGDALARRGEIRRRAAGQRRRDRRRPRRRRSAPRYDAPRGAPRGSRRRRLAAQPGRADRARASLRPGEPVIAFARFEDLIALAAEKRDLAIKTALERDVRLVRFEDGQLEISVLPSAPKTLGRRSFAQARGLDRAALDGGGLVGGGRSDGSAADGNQQSGARCAACARTRWCRRCWSAFPAPKSWTCAGSETASEAVPGADMLPDPERED